MESDFEKELPTKRTKYDDLLQVLNTTKANFSPIPGVTISSENHWYYDPQLEIDCNEVYPGIFIGDGATAQNKEYLKRINITHVLNAAQGCGFGFVNTDEKFYKDTNITFLGLPLADLPMTDISKHFELVADFIDDALNSKGRVFVHCLVGMSRSATCVLAFLMIKRHMLATDAMYVVRQNRAVRPNNGFLHQLTVLDNKLRQSRA